jgi:anti-sigma-K factor RskA
MTREADIVDYLLDELSPEDRLRVERRMAEDDLFRAEVDRLRPLVTELEALPGEAWEPGEVPPLPVLPPLPASPPERRGRISLSPWLAVAAAVVALAVGVAVGVLVRDGGEQPATGPSIALAPLGGADPAARATATMVDDANGMRLDASGLAPLPSGEFYEVWLLDGPERVMSLGSFRVPASGDAHVTVPLPVDAADFRYVDVSVEREDGDPSHSGASVLRGPTGSA